MESNIEKTEVEFKIDNTNANETFFKLKEHFSKKLLLGEFIVCYVDINMVEIIINDITFRLGVDYYRCEMHMDNPFFDGRFFNYINQEQSKKVFESISKFGLTKAISDKENLLKQIEQELTMMRSRL